MLGEGGKGRVYRVRHRVWEAELAVKSAHPQLLATPRGAEGFVREAETWVGLGFHPHLVSCYYVRTLGGVPHIFAEYVEGGTLRSWIERGGLRELPRLLDVAIQVAWGLAYAHERGLVHQDVKPDNVLMTPQVRRASGRGEPGGGRTPLACSGRPAPRRRDSRRRVRLRPGSGRGARAHRGSGAPRVRRALALSQLRPPRAEPGPCRNAGGI